MARLEEHAESLWWLALSPGVWVVHFVLSYATVAIWCEKFGGEDGSLGAARSAVFVYTAVGLVAIAFSGWRALGRHKHQGGEVPHHDDTPEDRHRFLGFAGLLLAGLSAVAMIYVALAAVFIGSCR